MENQTNSQQSSNVSHNQQQQMSDEENKHTLGTITVKQAPKIVKMIMPSSTQSQSKEFLSNLGDMNHSDVGIYSFAYPAKSDHEFHKDLALCSAVGLHLKDSDINMDQIMVRQLMPSDLGDKTGNPIHVNSWHQRIDIRKHHDDEHYSLYTANPHTMKNKCMCIYGVEYDPKHNCVTSMTFWDSNGKPRMTIALSMTEDNHEVLHFAEPMIWGLSNEEGPLKITCEIDGFRMRAVDDNHMDIKILGYVAQPISEYTHHMTTSSSHSGSSGSHHNY